MRFRIGKELADGSTPAVFTIRREEDGGIHLGHFTSTGLTDSERQFLYAHFGSPKTGRSGGEDNGKLYESIETLQPGTEKHFLYAVYQIPKPFVLLGGA